MREPELKVVVCLFVLQVCWWRFGPGLTGGQGLRHSIWDNLSKPIASVGRTLASRRGNSV